MFHSSNTTGPRADGFALLIVLAAVAIMLILTMADFSIFTGGRIPASKIVDAAETPWKHEDMIVVGEHFPIEHKQRDKAVISTDIALSSEVTREAGVRGLIEMDFFSSGDVKGLWSCEYEHSRSQYYIEADFSGNIVPDENRRNLKGVQKDLLFFITKGTYTQTSMNKSTNRRITLTDTVYVAGWVRPDFSVFGKITLMAKDQYQADYDFNTPGNSADFID